MENVSTLHDTYELLSPSLPVLEIVKYTWRIVFQLLVMILGVTGNGLILLVYKNKRQKTSTHVFIMTLAMADLSVSLMRILDIADDSFRLAGYERTKVIDLLRPIEYTAVGTTIVVTTMIAADRYDCVCRPLRRFFNHTRAEKAAWASLMLSFTVNIPSIIDEIMDSNSDFLIAFLLVFQVIAYLVNLVMIIICYRLVYITIRKHVQVGTEYGLRGKNTSVIQSGNQTNLPSVSGSSTCTSDVGQVSNGAYTRYKILPELPKTLTTDASESVGTKLKLTGGRPVEENDEGTVQTVSSKLRNGNASSNGIVQADTAGSSLLQRKTTKMLFIASVVFLLTWMPYWVFVGKALARENGVRINPVFHVVIDEARCLVYINNIVNPLIYGFSNSRFRKDCKVVLSRIRFF